MKTARCAASCAAMGVALLLASSAYAQDVHADHVINSSPNLVQAVRAQTAAFFDVRNVPAGYAPVLGCVSGPQEGAMGLHYLNGPQVMGGGLLTVGQPEALIYEKRGNRETLVAVEYIVDAAKWDAAHPDGAVPALMGQDFQFVDAPNRYRLNPFYELHVWAWRDNPHGSFVDWNPEVTCDGYVKNP
jgi:hypothetical protein